MTNEPSALYQLSWLVFIFLAFCFLTSHVADDVFALCGTLLLTSGGIILWHKLAE
jgi:hypothetical protein